MIVRLTAILTLSLLTLPSALAQELSGDYLYKVSTIRAATGELSGLLDWIAQLKESDYFEMADEYPPLVMRHSQGDQWDLMMITPMESWTSYYSESSVGARDEAMAAHVELL